MEYKEYITQRLSELGSSQAELGRFIGVTRQQINQYTKGVRTPSRGTRKLIEIFFERIQKEKS